MGADTVEHGVTANSYKLSQDTIEAAHCLLQLNHQESLDSKDRIASILSKLLKATKQRNMV